MKTNTLNASLFVLILSLATRSACESALIPPQVYAAITTPPATSTPDPPASFVLDDPANSAATTSDQSSDQWDEVCYKCLDKVQLAQDNVETYENILRKQKKLIAQMKAAVEAIASAERRPARTNSRNNRSPNGGPPAVAQNSSLQTRSIQPESQWIVSTLRVARSADQPPSSRLRNKDKYVTNKKDAELERLKREQQQQKDKTCNALIEARDCLDSITRECTGFLQYHMYDVFIDQYHGKLRCPYANNPNIKPLPIQGTRTYPLDDEPKQGIARPIPPTPEQIRDKLHEMLPSRQYPKPLGVILKPTFNNNNNNNNNNSPSSVVESASQQQQQSKGSYATRGFPAYHPQVSHQQFSTGDFGDASMNMVNIGRMLLVPCCFAVMVALLALASLHYKTVKEDEEDERAAANASKC